MAVTLKITLKEKSVDIANNKSRVEVLVQATSDVTYNYLGTTTGGTVKISLNGGSAVTIGSCAGKDIVRYSTVTLFSYSTDVAHNTDGTGSVTISVSSLRCTSNTTAAAVSKTLTLTSIPRASTITFAEDTYYLGRQYTFNIVKSLSTYKSTVTYNIAKGDGTFWAEQTALSESANTSFTLNLARESLSGRNTANYVDVIITIKTYDSAGSTLIGVNTYNKKFYIQPSWTPYVNADCEFISYSDDTNLTIGLNRCGTKRFKGCTKFKINSLYVQSTLNVCNIKSIVVSGDFGSVDVLPAGTNTQVYETEDWTSPIINGVKGTNKVTLTVTDKRGMVTTNEYTVTLAELRSPIISNTVLTRGDYDESTDTFTENPVNGTTMKFDFKINSLAGVSSVSCYLGEGTEGEWAASIRQIGNGNGTLYIPGVTPDENTTITVLTYDFLIEGLYYLTAMAGRPDVNYNPAISGIAVGVVATKEKTIEISDAWSVEMNGSPVADTVIEQGKDATTGWWYRKWSSGMCELWGRFTINIETLTTAGSLYTSESNSIDYPFTVYNACSSGLCAGLYGWIASAGTGTNKMSFRFLRHNNITNKEWTAMLRVDGYWKNVS